jgi:hypothetical protein
VWGCKLPAKQSSAAFRDRIASFTLRLRSGQALQQNANQYVPRQGMKREVAADIRAIFFAPDRAQAEAQLRKPLECNCEPPK